MVSNCSAEAVYNKDKRYQRERSDNVDIGF